MKFLKCFICLISLGNITSLFAQPAPSPVDYRKIFSYSLDGDVRSALFLIQQYNPEAFTAKDSMMVNAYLARFGYEQDSSDYLAKRKSALDPLLLLYKNYWRKALLAPDENYDSSFTQRLALFLSDTCNSPMSTGETFNDDSINTCLKDYVGSFGYKTTGFSKTGKLYDLLVWKAEQDTIYSFFLHGEKTSAKVIFMDDFVTLGWEEYASLDRLYPGGWATKEALYCVKKAYDLSSESFLISYLAHESRHFSDYKLFPHLQSADLEYRAKLTELSMLNDKLYETLSFFLSNAHEGSENGHSFANYCVIRDLSRLLFNSDFEADLEKWKGVGVQKINEASYAVLEENTKKLKEKGMDVTTLLK